MAKLAKDFIVLSVVFAASAHPYVWSSYALEKGDKSACFYQCRIQSFFGHTGGQVQSSAAGNFFKEPFAGGL